MEFREADAKHQPHSKLIGVPISRLPRQSARHRTGLVLLGGPDCVGVAVRRQEGIKRLSRPRLVGTSSHETQPPGRSPGHPETNVEGQRRHEKPARHPRRPTNEGHRGAGDAGTLGEAWGTRPFAPAPRLRRVSTGRAPRVRRAERSTAARDSFQGAGRPARPLHQSTHQTGQATCPCVLLTNAACEPPTAPGRSGPSLPARE